MALTQVKSEGIADGAVTPNDLADSGVTAGTYGSSSAIPAITVDAKGRVTSASTNAISVESDRIFEGNTSAEAVDTGSDGHFKVITEGFERARIDSSGRLGIGNNIPGSFYSGSNQLVVGNTGDQGITIKTGTSDIGRLHFADGTTGNQAYRGRIEYVHASDYMQFGTAGRNSDLVIDSSGRVGIGTASPGDYGANVQLAVGNPSGIGSVSILAGTSSNGSLYFADGTSGTATYAGYLQYRHATNSLAIGTAASDRVIIDSNGRLLVGTPSGTGVALLQVQGYANGNTGVGLLELKKGSTTPANGEELGRIDLSDSSSGRAATIVGARDGGTWTSGSSHPGLLKFSTTANGASSPTERMTITSAGTINIGSVARIENTGAVKASNGTASAPSFSFLSDPDNGMWRPATNQLAFSTAGSERVRIDTTGLFKFNSGFGSVATAYGVRAWVNFNGAGTLTIRGSGNISSVTDNGVGQFAPNFSNAMPDTNYAGVCSHIAISGGNDGAHASPNTTSAASIQTGSAGAWRDPTVVCAAFFR
jgi:hypothetical protein